MAKLATNVQRKENEADIVEHGGIELYLDGITNEIVSITLSVVRLDKVA